MFSVIIVSIYVPRYYSIVYFDGIHVYCSLMLKKPLQIHIFNLSLMRAMFVPQIKPFPYAGGLIVKFA